MIRQKLTKTITSNYTTTDADNGYRIICNSSSELTITLHSASGRYNYELEVDNIGSDEVTVGGRTLKQYTHAHIGNNGGASWAVVVGGGSMSKAEIEAVLTGELTSHSHAPYTLPQATDTTLGGIKAKAKTTESSEVAIDEATGKLYVPAAGEAANGIPAGGTENQLLAKNSGEDYDGKWVNAPAAANGIPSGGTAGQHLRKKSATDYDAEWKDPISCRAYHSTTQTVATSTQTPLALDSERWDDGSMHDNTTNNTRLTVPTGEGGLYMIGGCATLSSNTTNKREISIRLNGTTMIAANQYPAYQETRRFFIETVTKLSDGDYVELMLWQNSGSTLTVEKVDGLSPEFWIAKIG